MKILLIILLLFACFIPQSTTITTASSRYARAIESANLYKTCNGNTLSDIMCLVEKSYFVLILSEVENNFRVEYNGVIGYVKKNDVKEITSTPSTPYPYNIKLTLLSDCNLRNSPTTKNSSNNIITTLKKGENNFEFIGRIFADEAIDFGGTTWYFVKYNGNYGYIYNKYVKSISPIYENTESVSFLKEVNQTPDNPITHTPSLLIMIILFIPCLFILLILYIPKTRKVRIKKPKASKIIVKY